MRLFRYVWWSCTCMGYRVLAHLTAVTRFCFLKYQYSMTLEKNMDFFERIAPGRLTRRAENQAGRALLEDRCTKKQFDMT